MKNKRKLFKSILYTTLMVIIGFVIAACENPTTVTDPDEETVEKPIATPTTGEVAKPTADPAAGEVASGTTITLSTSTAGAEIWYTTNGNTPAKSGSGSTKYETPISITATVTIKAIAVKDGMNDSAILEAAYTIAVVNTVAKPSADPAEGEVANGTTVTLSSSTSGVEIWYTTNGNAPAKNGSDSTKYETPIAIITAVTIKAIAFKDGMNDSAILEAAYTITAVNTVAKPIAYPAAGEVASGTTVTLSSSTTGAEIWYTTNGNNPAKNGSGSTKYETPITITTAVTIKAIAVKDGMNDSAILEAAYTIILLKASTPIADPPAGVITSGTTVTLATATEGAAIHYTTNGDIPTASSTEYTSPVVITTDLTIKAIAIKEGMINSDILGAAYFISRPVATVYYGEAEIPQNGTINGGEVLITLSKYITVEIRNTGTEVLNFDVANLSITGDHAAAFTPTTSPGSSVSVGDSTSFDIQCSPTIQGENTATLTIPTNDSSRNPIVINLKVTGAQGHAILELKNGNTIIENNSPTPFSLGQVIVGTQSPQYPFTITNTGNIALHLTGNPVITSSNPVFTVSLSPASTMLNPEASAEFRIRYTPTEEPPATGTITIENNSDEGTFTFTVTGRGYIYKPVVSIIYDDGEIMQNETIDAGAVPIGQSKPITIIIKNMGDANLAIDAANITITGTDMAAFSKTTTPSANVHDGDQTSFTISCSPIKAGESTATLTIPTNDPNRPNVIVNLKVTGGTE